ncbi:MAG: ABC transporter permease [Gemmatimonadaceae bacterium]|nr:ABC transporter permease [Gemmatimonadaceae bacterium]
MKRTTVWSRPSTRVAVVTLAIFFLGALFAPVVAPYNPTAQPDIVALKDLPPSVAHPFGTDPYSRDVLSRVVYGARLSMGIGFLATLISVTLGVAYGAMSGLAGGFVDAVMMRVLDAFMAIPRLLLLIALLAAWHSLPITTLILFLGFTGWFSLSRIVRGQVLALKESEFVMAARAIGANRGRIVVTHLLPNLYSVIVVAATLGFAHVIVLEAGLSYLGIGVPQPLASWGNIIQDGAENVSGLWWLSLFPGLALLAAVIALNTLGERIRETFQSTR